MLEHPNMNATAEAARQGATHHITIPGETFEAWVDVNEFGEDALAKLVKALGRTVGVTYAKDGSVNPNGRNAHRAPVVTELHAVAA